jgi:hypothetical protein
VRGTVSGKERTVYFFSAIEVDQDDHITEFESDYWDALFERIRDLGEDERRQEIRSRKYEGEIRFERAPEVEYLYLGKLRPGADWPDIRNAEGEHASLASTGVVGALIEPAYIVRVARTPYIAILRSSGGPTFTAIASWLSTIAGYDFLETRLELQPYARKDQLERLASAVGATRLHLKVDGDALQGTEPRSRVLRAMKAVQDTGSGSVSVEMIVSYGNASPDEAGAEDLAEGVSELVRAIPFKKAVATLLVDRNDGIVKDYVDFSLDRVTLTESVGNSEDEEPTPRVILGAMSDAIGRFREQI